ncbi:MAG: prepilin-type N-terminal cleavage/methylation domain-containing protein [Alphaproteobacteria bacterium]|nr:prepilin-type N-terminal cleavage/methylation domain-containing protein [Alphaproteobacteria bacterium]
MNKKRTNLDGFSLMEISIVLLIIGIIAGGMLKGKDLIENAQIKSVVNDIQNFRIAYASYINLYDALPGDDSEASSRFSSVSNGDGDGKISPSDAKNILPHLYAAGLIDSIKRTPKIGGNYDIISENNIPMLRISKKETSFLNKKQIISISAKIKELIGDIDIIVDPPISENSSQKHTIKISLD